jgi:two-component sensor histidine kinase
LRRFPRALPVILFALAMAGTLGGVFVIERAAQETRQVELERSAGELVAALEQRAVENTASLRAAAALMTTTDGADRSQFAHFASALTDDKFHLGALGLGWAPVLDGAAVAAHEAAQQQAVRGYAVTPPPAIDAATVVPATFFEPASSHDLSSLGFDMYSEPVRRAAMKHAIVARAPAASGKVQLLRDDAQPGSSGFIVFMPVFHGSGTKVRGFVYSPFRASDFIAAATGLATARSRDVAIYDGAAEPGSLLAQRRLGGAGGLRVALPLHIAERQWLIEVNDQQRLGLTLAARLTLLFGLILALMIALIARIVSRQAAEDHEVVELLSSEAAIRISLTRELNHRVKNTLANVLSIVSLTRRRATGLDEFSEGLSGRIRALSATHDLLSQSDWSAASIEEIIRSELAPYMAEGDGHVDIAGPRIALAPNDALSLGLAVHELATNAAKYGALSTAAGRVEVSWHLMSPELAEVKWRETGGPTVEMPNKRGFGRDLIEKIVANELNNTVELNFASDGVRCRLRVPVRRSAAFEIRQG